MENIKNGQLNIDTNYLLPEVRNGFYIPTPMKQAWAADLYVLSVIDEICTKHNISYFADWGTLLGTVRHAGIIPWDDDIDICMKREDYTRFCEVAMSELPEEFCMHKYDTQEDFWLFLARVVSKDRICFEEDHLRKYHGFPYMASVDIFVLDYMFADEKKEQARRENLLYLLAVAEEIIAGKRHANDRAILANLDEAQKRLHTHINRFSDDRKQCIEIYKVVEKEFENVPENERGNLTQMMPWGLKGKGFVISPKYYEKSIRLPFEMTTMPVPYAYDAMLRRKYGNYLKPIKSVGGHDYPFYEGQKRALQEVLDFEIPEYRFEKGSLKIPTDAREAARNQSAKNVIREVLGDMKSLLETSAEEHIADFQQIALDIGNYIEEIWGEQHYIINDIQIFCEKVYEIYQKTSFDESEVIDAVNEFISNLSDRFLNKSEVIFICDSEESLEALRDFYEEETEAGNDVYIQKIINHDKDYDGKVLYDAQIEGTKSAGFKSTLELRFPDRIYICNPYDDTDACHSIEPFYYARNIRNFTSKLIFVSPLDVPDFDETMERDYYNIKYFLNTPGVTYSDKVFVRSDKLRETYIKKLSEFAGDNTCEIWNERIEVKNKKLSINSNTSDQKKLLYVIGLGNIYENQSYKESRILDALKVIEEAKDKLDFTICIYPNKDDLPEEIAKKLSKYSERMISAAKINVSDMKAFANNFSAYYGDASPLVPVFMEMKKPIMIAN